MLENFAPALSMGLGVILPALAIGMIGSKGLEAIARQPEAAPKIQVNMILAIAFAEGLGILVFVISLLLINKIQ